MSVTVNARLKAGTEPTTRMTTYRDSIGIPVVSFTGDIGSDTVSVQMNPDDPHDAIRYLRQLAAVATDLADEVERRAEHREQQVAEAVLLS